MIEKIVAWILSIMMSIVGTVLGSYTAEIQQGVLERQINEFVSSMSLEEKIGQMLLVSFNGTTYNAEIKKLITEDKVGGYVFFANNIGNYNQVVNLTKKMSGEGRKFQIAAPFIAVDQEGGVVSRLDDIFCPFPGNMALGAANDEELTYEQGRITGLMLKHLGFNLNFAPDIDVNSDYRNPVIGLRSFGSKPELVARMGKAFYKGQHEVGVISCVKHFPGHGNVWQDSHYELPVNNHSINELKKKDIKPFETLADEGVGMIMTAHIKVPVLDPQNPATLSKKILQGELRESIKYDGVIITDDIGSMKAITSTYCTEGAAVKAVQAGADIVLVVSQPQKIKDTLKALKNAVLEGKISEDRINQSVFRILKLKYVYGLFEKGQTQSKAFPDYKSLYEMTVNHSEAVSDAAATVLSNQNKNIPIKNKKVLFLAYESRVYRNPLTRQSETLEDLVGQYFNDFDVIYIKSQESIEEIKRKSNPYEKIVFLSEKGHKYNSVKNLLRYFQNNKKFILVSLAEPYEPMYLGNFHTHVAVYSDHRESILSGLRVLKGEIEGRSGQ